MYKVKFLINFHNKVNVITSGFVDKLGLTSKTSNNFAQKIDDSPLKIYDIVLAGFLLQDSFRKVRFFEKTFLLADTSIKVVLKILFLSFSNADFQFSIRKFN